MTKPTSNPIDSILETSKEFNEAAERAANILRNLDAQLQQTGIGTSVYLDGDTGLRTEEGGKCYEHRLGYDRVHGTWSICINRWHSDPEKQRVTEDEIFPLQSASRMLRMHFIEYVPALLARLQEEAKEQRDMVKRRTSVLDTLEAGLAVDSNDKAWSARSLDRPKLAPNSDKAWSARSLDLLNKK
jgi:hypothetical protein